MNPIKTIIDSLQGGYEYEINIRTARGDFKGRVTNHSFCQSEVMRKPIDCVNIWEPVPFWQRRWA